MQSKSTSVDIYQIKITLKGCKPPVWRRIQLVSTINMAKLHQILQEVMGWGNRHMHQFHIMGECYGDVSSDNEVLDEKKIKLCQAIACLKGKFIYEYDFGDSWEHEIRLEKIISAEAGVRYPTCIAGKGACPPEDCGGIYGYANLLDIIQDPENPEHDEMNEWLGKEFDPEAFDIDKINKALVSIK